MGYTLKPVQEETQVPRCRTTRFEGTAILLYGGEVDAAHLIPRSVLTPTQAGITWGRARRTTLAVVPRGVWAGAKSSAPRELRKTINDGSGIDQPRELSVSA